MSSFVFINPVKNVSDCIDIICKKAYKGIVDNEQDLRMTTAEEAVQAEYDLLLDLTSTSNTRAISTKVKARTKIGSYRTVIHKIRSYLLGTYSYSFKSKPFNNIVKYYLPFAEAVGVKCDEAPVLRSLLDPQIGALFDFEGRSPVIGVHVSGTDPVRQLPLGLVREIIAYIDSIGGASVLIGDRERAIETGLELPSVYYREESITELVATLSQLDYVIGPDSGVLHLAVALGTESLGIYSVNLSSVTGPPGERVRFLELDLDCRPCTNTVDCEYHIRCMNDIDFSDVKKEIDRAVNRVALIN